MSRMSSCVTVPAGLDLRRTFNHDHDHTDDDCDDHHDENHYGDIFEEGNSNHDITLVG